MMMENADKTHPVLPLSKRNTASEKAKLPVAVMDSGVGGLCVLHEIRRVLPCEELLYFGDSAFAPYGEKESQALKEHILCEAERLLLESKALVLACNTATALVAEELRQRHPEVPIIGMEPALKPALGVCENARVLVLATALTLREEKFAELTQKCAMGADVVPLSAPRIVEMVEAGAENSPEMDAYLWDLLAPYRAHVPDALVLGCTHFPFVKERILRALGRDVPVFDGVRGTARQVYRLLAEGGLCNPSPARGAVRLTSSRAGVLPLYARMLFGALD
jgi:glutamate racemase